MGKESVRIVVLSLTSILFLTISCRSTVYNSERANKQLEPFDELVKPTIMPETAIPTKKPQSTLTANEVTEKESPADAGLVTLTISKTVNHLGEMVEFSVNNHSDADVYYTYGCSWPIIYRKEAGEEIGITVTILDVEPGLFSLAPGETHNCSWDQMAWQDPIRQGPARYQHYIEQLQVPSGVYQFRLDYFFDPEDLYSYEKHETTWSQALTIE